MPIYGLPNRFPLLTVDGNTNIGLTGGVSRLTVQTRAAELVRGFDLYHSADQTNPSNQYVCFGIHNYTDGPSAIIDTVGSQQSLVLRQARNPAARPDKPSTYVGDGIFLDFQRSRVSGPGNLGTGNDRLLMVDANGCLSFYGSSAADWNGSASTAPIKIGTYTNGLNRLGYFGYEDANNRLVIGAIDAGGSAFRPIRLVGSAIQFVSGTTALDATAIPAGGTTGAGYKFFSTANFGFFAGSGAPTLSAAKGSYYARSDGSGTNDRAYINTDGGTTWTAIVTVA